MEARKLARPRAATVGRRATDGCFGGGRKRSLAHRDRLLPPERSPRRKGNGILRNTPHASLAHDLSQQRPRGPGPARPGRSEILSRGDRNLVGCTGLSPPMGFGSDFPAVHLATTTSTCSVLATVHSSSQHQPQHILATMATTTTLNFPDKLKLGKTSFSVGHAFVLACQVASPPHY